MTFLGKLADQEDGRLMSQNNHLIRVWMPVSFIEHVVVVVQVGKEFLDMRQNERKLKSIRVADASRIEGQLKGQPTAFVGSAGKKSACNVGDLGSTPGLGRSPGEGNS